MEERPGSLYDYPKYYELVFGSDWRAEFDFLLACFKRHAKRPVRRVFEPACGTGRLLVRLAAAGYEVAGNDLSAKAVGYCNARLERRGLPPAVRVGDMSRFRLRRKVDAALNMIGSFRHLTSGRSALGHLRCVAEALAPGGIYVVGLHLTPTLGQPINEERWAARRGHLGVTSHLRTVARDLRRRTESVRMTLTVHTPKRWQRLVDQLQFRTYTVGQFHSLVRRTGGLRIVATYDFAYDIDRPIQVGPRSEDVVYVLRKV